MPDPLEDFLIIPDPQERLMWITERGRRLPAFDDTERTDQHRVPGCVSAVWMIDETSNGQCNFRGDAQAPVLRGLVRLICDRANGREVTVVAEDATDVVAALGIERHLTPTRVQGLRSVQAFVRSRAQAHASTSS